MEDKTINSIIDIAKDIAKPIAGGVCAAAAFTATSPLIRTGTSGAITILSVVGSSAEFCSENASKGIDRLTELYLNEDFSSERLQTPKPTNYSNNSMSKK